MGSLHRRAGVDRAAESVPVAGVLSMLSMSWTILAGGHLRFSYHRSFLYQGASRSDLQE